MRWTIRAASPADAEAIARLTTHYILHTSIHFGLEPWTAAEVEAAMRTASETAYPWRVALDAEGGFAGYAKAGPWRSRPAYRFTAETAVYVEPAQQGGGLGRRLYEALLDALAQAAFHVAVAGVTQPNPSSEALHRKLGFVEVGLFTEVGFKEGAWRDVRWFERRLGEAPESLD